MEHPSNTRKYNRTRRLYQNFFYVVIWCTLSIAIIRIPSFYTATPSLLFCLYFLTKPIKQNKLNRTNTIITLSFLTYFLSIAVSWGPKLDLAEFLKSFVQTFIFIALYVGSLRKTEYIIDNDQAKSIIKNVTYLIFLFQLLQISEQFVYGSNQLWFFLDGISISTADNISRFEAVNYLGFNRPISIYHEPSYLGLVYFLFLIINYEITKAKNLNYLLLIGILLTLSSLIILISTLYMTYKLLSGTTLRLRMLYSFLVVFMIAANFNILYEASRIAEIFTPGTSGHERLILPLETTATYIRLNLLGIPLGAADAQLNNSLFLFPLYFGIFSVLIPILLHYVVKKHITNPRTIVGYYFALLAVLLTNGAIFTPESTFILVFINMCFKTKIEKCNIASKLDIVKCNTITHQI